MLLTSVYDQSKIQRKETGLLPYGYCLGGVLVSFFICKIQLLTKNLHATINLQMFIIRNEARVHVFFITVNLNDYNTAVKPPGKCRILTKKCQIVPMKCRILQEKYRIVPIKCQILQIRCQIMCRRSINMYWKKASLFITTAKAVGILRV